MCIVKIKVFKNMQQFERQTERKTQAKHYPLPERQAIIRRCLITQLVQETERYWYCGSWVVGQGLWVVVHGPGLSVGL